MVPEVGLEPTCPCERGILSPLRLPFRHSGRQTWMINAVVAEPKAWSDGLWMM